MNFEFIQHELQNAGLDGEKTSPPSAWTWGYGTPGTYEIYTGKKNATPNILDRKEPGELAKALKAEDVKRRLNEAETFIKQHQATRKAAQRGAQPNMRTTASRQSLGERELENDER